MSKYFLLICVFLTIICIESSRLSDKSIKSSNGKLKISIEYGTDDDVNKCDDECKGNCNNTCGPDPRCRFNCYVEECRCPGKAKKEFGLNRRGGLLGCTTKCREYCNNTCGENLKCREQCYVKTCQCPPPESYDDSDVVEDGDDGDEIYQIREFLKPQKPQCCPVCMSKCIHRCDKSKDKCAKYCKNKCCHDPNEWN